MIYISSYVWHKNKAPTKTFFFFSFSVQFSSVQFSSVQSLSHVELYATPCITARQASLSITNSWSSLKLTSIELVMPSSHLILCRPLLLLPPIPPSIRVFSSESTPWGCWESQLSDFTLTFHFHALEMHRKWQPTPVFLPGESQGQRSLVGCCLWGRTESDTTEVT